MQKYRITPRVRDELLNIDSKLATLSVFNNLPAADAFAILESDKYLAVPSSF